MKPEVLVMSRWYPTPRQPDAYPFIRDWAVAASRVADIRVLHLDSEETTADRCELLRENDGSITHGLETWRLEMGHAGMSRPRILLREIAAIIRAVESVGPIPNILHAHVFTIAPHAFACRIRFGVPYVVTEHFSRFRRSDFHWYHRVQALTTLPPAARILTVSDPLANAMRRRGVMGRYETVANPVDTSIFRPTPVPPGDALDLVTVGKLVPLKGTDILLESLARIGDPTVSLTVIGDGPQRPELEALAYDLGVADRVTFIGAVSRSEVSRRLQKCHALVVPSLIETFSIVAAEALAAGRPVVATRCGGPETFIGHDEGVVVEPGSPDLLAEGILTLRARLRAGHFDPLRLSRFAAEHFSFSSVAERLKGIYADIIGSRRSPQRGG